MSALGPLQVAMVARLKTDGPLTAVIGARVYDGMAPQGAATPYVVIVSTTEENARTLDRAGWSDTITCRIVTMGPGGKQANEIVPLMHAALGSPLTVAGYALIGLRCDMNETLDEPPDRFGRALRYRTFAIATA